MKVIHIYSAIGSDKMKKIIISIFVILLMTGCKAKYTIDFENDTVKEHFDVVVDKTEEYSLKYLKEKDFYVSFNPEMVKYEKKITENKENTIFNYSHSYNISEYDKSMALSSCFKGHSVISEDNYYLISTSEGVKCMTSDYSTIIDEIDVVINTNHKYIDSNADEIKNNSYIWHINKDNYEKKHIMLKVYKDKYTLNYKNNSLKKVIVPLAILIIGVVVGVYIYIKKKRVNNI